MKVEINNRTKNKVNIKLIERTVKRFAGEYRIKAKEVSLAIVGDSEMKKLNSVWRGKNQPTDILAFPGDNEFFGEIIIDYNQIKRQAVSFDNSPQEEIVFIIIHGLLHLLGYNDETENDKNQMIEMGEEFIRKNF